MRERLDTAITVNFFLLVGWSGLSAADILHDIPKHNPLNIDWDPAPSPEDGPPLSRGALRNPAYLPAEISGIVGAYIFSVCVVGLAILLIGRRLRRQLTESAKALDVEMVEPPKHLQYKEQSPVTSTTTPLTPGGNPASPRNFSWPSPEKPYQNSYIFPSTGGLRSPHSPDSYVDRQVVKADQEMLLRDLEDIYAHVMEQEDAKAAGVRISAMPLPPTLQAASPPPVQRSSTPKKIEKSRPANLDIEEPKSRHTSRASSIISSIKSPRRKEPKAMVISAPIPTPMSATFPSSGSASDEEPLSPRYYAPPPPPPIPKDQVPYTHVRKTSKGSLASPTRMTADQFSTNRAQMPRSNLSQTSLHSRDPTSASSVTSQTPLFPAQTHRQPPLPDKSSSTVNLPPSNNSSVRQLPLRHFDPALQSPSFSYSTKTTVLERQNPLSPGLTTGGGLRTPWSAGATPYSPYQPFTPMMPITPRLVTRQDRKMMKKMEPRTPVMEMIKSEDDLFDSAY